MTQLVQNPELFRLPLSDFVAGPMRELLLSGREGDEASRLRRFTGFARGALLDRLAVEAGGCAAPALLTLYPAVHMAWADGEADDEERRRIRQAAWELELDGHPRGWAMLEAWLTQPPPLGVGVLFQEFVTEAAQTWTAQRYAHWRAAVLGLAMAVAEATGGGWFSKAVSPPEAAWLEALEASLDPLKV
jgi:tellurite resistance protein